MNTENKVKILHIAQSAGGVERYLKMFFKHFNNNTYQNYLIVSGEYRESKKYFEELGVKIYIIDMVREISFKDDIIAMSKIYRLLIKIKPNIVYSHSSKAGALSRILAKIVGAFNIYNPHGWAFDMNVSSLKKNMYLWIEKILGLFTDKVIAISEYEKEVAINYHVVNEKKIAVVENGIDINPAVNEVLDNFLQERKWPEESFIIGMVARITEQKSPKTFIEIASVVAQKIPNARFLMVGDGEQRAMIESMINDYNLQDKVFITGWVREPLKYIAQFDVALLTSNWEGFGLVIPEYMLYKVPVIASNVGGIKNIIKNEETGILIDNLNVDEFVNRILEVYKNEKLRNVMVEQAYQMTISRFDFYRNIREHIVVFEELIN